MDTRMRVVTAIASVRNMAGGGVGGERGEARRGLVTKLRKRRKCTGGRGDTIAKATQRVPPPLPPPPHLRKERNG